MSSLLPMLIPMLDPEDELFGAELEAAAELWTREVDDDDDGEKNTDDVVAERATYTDGFVVEGATYTDDVVADGETYTDDVVAGGGATDEVIAEGAATDEVDRAGADEVNGQKTTMSVAVMVVTIRG